MARLTWDQAISDYEKKKQSGNTTTSLPTSGMLTWQQAADEYDQHDEDSYKALGQQRITERQQKVVQREERATVSDWFRRYNSVMQGASDYKSRGRAESLIADFEGIKDLAERYGVTDSGQYLDQLNQILDYYNQFDSEDAYNSYVSQREQYEAMSNFDTKAGAREIAQLESTLAEYQNLTRWMTDEKGEARAAAIRQQYGGEDEIQALIQQKRQYLNQSQRLQDGIAMSAVVDNPDFKEMSGYVSTETPGTRLGFIPTTTYDDAYEYINNQNDFRARYNAEHQMFRPDERTGDGETSFQTRGYDHLTDDEIAIYNYYYAKDSKEAAQKYLDSIQETLNMRKATAMFGTMEEQTALELAFGWTAGLDQFASGVKGLEQALSGEADYIPMSAVQMASGMVREDLGDVGAKLPEWMGGATLGQAGYDTVTTTANMVPSIMTSMALGAMNPVAGSAAGTALMGASAGGNAYQEMLNLGYDKGQARTYAALVGSSEAGLQYLLGGIGSLGGKVSGNVVGKIMNGVDNAFARTAIKLGGNMLSEGFEEGLQEILTPWFQNLVLHADEDINWGEVAYSSLLGALTAGFMEGGSTISGEVNTYQTGRQLQGGGITAQRLADIGTTFSADTVAHQLAGRVNENTGAYTMGRLFNEIGAELTEQNKADIVQSLVNKGVDPDHAQIHADVMAYIMEGGQLSDIQMRMIEQNDVLAKTMQEVIIDPNSTVNQRIKGFNEAHAALTGKTPEVSAPVAEQSAQTEAAASAENTAPTAEEVPAEGHYESSAEGKTILKSSGETVTIKEIAAIKNGKMTLKLDDGRTVDASDVSYSSQDEALVYEAVADMGTNAVAADLLVKAFAPGGISAQDYVHGIKEAYTYGQYNFPMKEAENGPFSSVLSAEQRNTAYKLGQIFSGKQVAKAQATVRGNRTVAKNATTDHSAGTTKKVGKVHFDRNGRTFDDVREVSLKTMEQLSAALGVEFYVFESYVNESGHRVYKTENGKEVAAPNGFYDPKDGSIHIDLNAGRDGKGTMLFTVAHELTHFIRQWSPAKFKVLANFLNQQYGEKGKSVSALVDEQIAKAKRNGRTISYAVAYEEVVADSMESMLTDGNVVQMMSDLAQQDKSLWQKICEWFKDMVSDLKAIVDAYTGKSPDSIEGKLVADMQDVIIILESLYADALVDASENRRTSSHTGHESGSERYSFAGENAHNADLDALKRAKEMKAAGVADETIRQQTGWHVGMDGKWRWEIDDSRMRYHRGGDAQFSADHPDYARHQELIQKMIYGTLSAGEEHELRQLDEMWGRERSRLGERVDRGNATLGDILRHDELFEAYPQLRKMRVRFDNLPDGVRGQMNREENAVVLNKSLRNAPEDTLIHEIQHAIQDAEGFAGGSSSEFWSDKRVTKPEYEAEIQKAKDAVREVEGRFRKEWRDDINLNLAKQYVEMDRQYWAEEADESVLEGYTRQMELIEEMADEAGWRDLLDDYFYANGEVQTATMYAELNLRTSDDLYRNTAGEIEARDAAARRQMDPETRRATKPTGADKDTVFVEDADIRYSSRDSDGNELSEEQRAFFAQSKVLDENGNLLKVYHGTPKKFTTFRQGDADGWGKGIYFTDNREDAAEYGENVVEAYLNITNPFDTRSMNYNDIGAENTEAYRDFDKKVWKQRFDEYDTYEEYKADGLGADLYEIYTEEVRVFNQIIRELGYDGIIAHHSNNINGLEIVAFHENQPKLTSNKAPTTGTDIRFSDRDPEQQRINRVLEKENAKLREDVTYLKELLKLQRSVTGGKKFTRTSVEAAATKLMKDASARGQKAELVGLLNGFYEYIAAGEELTWEGVVEQAQPVVQWLQANEHAKKQTNEYAADILRELRGTRISLDDLQKKEAAYQYGSFNEFRKKAMGSIIVTNTGVPLDVQWIELSRLYPNIFNPETTSNDMPAALLDAISTLRNMPAESEFGYDREMATQDLLHQVYDSYRSVSTLYTVADVKQREINRLKSEHHKRMTDLRETHRENTARLKQQHSEDLRRVRQEMRAAADAKQQKIVQKYQESRQKGIESRNKTAMRQKIKRVVSDLNQYLLNGTKDRHVPIELQKAVAEALDAVNMDTVGAEDRIAKLNKDLLKAKTPEKIQEISRKIDNIRAMGDRMSDRLKALHDAYDEIKNDEDPLMSNAYDDGLSEHMATLITEVGNTALRDMSMHQLECVYDVYQIVLTTVRNANKAFKAAKSESIAELGKQAMLEVRLIGGKKQYGMKGIDTIKEFGWNNLKPVYAFEHIGSGTLTELFNNVRAGEDTWAVDVTEARDYYLDKSRKYKYDTWDFSKRWKFTTPGGLDFSLNLEQIMSLYAYSKREQAADHLRRGGIVIDETTEVTMKTKLGIPVKFNPTEATAYNISDMTLAEIIGTLTAEQKGFVDEMQDYLSTVMGEKGNEVSLAMYGIKLFKEKHYFPLKSATQFMAKAKEQQQGEVKIKNAGFSKKTVKKASNPIVLTPFMNVWADHVNEMSMYHSFVLPMEDFYRVYNFKTPTSELNASQSVEMMIQNAYGKGATKYIDQLLKDLNGGARTDSTTGIINKGMALFKKGAVFASLSVVIQQPSAIARATALIDTKYFIGPKVDRKKHKALWAELKQYAPVAIIKEMGYFDTNMGKSTQDFILGREYSGFDEKMKALVTDSNYRDEILSKAPALADELAWCSIWEAVKRETVAKNPGMAANSDEFLQKAGQRFTEVITKTQVYDSVLSRSALMRSKDTGMKMATAFMAEPTTSINMVADALLKGKRGNRKYARGAIGAVIASNILNSILVSFVYAGRDDDEDKTYAEKYIGTLAGEVLDSLNPATYIPFIKDIVSIVQGYDVERSDMAVVSDLWNAWKKLSSGNLSAWQKVEGFAGSIAQIFGLPVKNIMRDVRGIYQTIQSFMSGQKTTGAGIGYAVKSAITGQDTSNKQQLYEAYLSGDKTQISRVESRFKDQSAINNAIRTALRENDSRIHAAAVARTNGNLTEYTRLAKEIIAEGHFSQDNVVAAINAEINAMKKGDTASASKTLGLYKVEDFAAAVSGGDSAMADAVRDDIIQTAQKNGKTADEAEKGFISSAKTAMKELFLSNGITETQAINALVSYCGETGDEAKQRVSEWAFEAEFGFAYGEKVQKFKDGEISAAELKGVLIDVDGKTDDEAAASIVSYSRDGYEEGFFSRDETAELMMQYGGLTRSEAEAKLRYIDFKIANPDVYADDAWIDEYYKEVQSSGISIDLFVEYRNRVKSMTGSNKKAQRMAVIDSLPISNDQKDALYYAEGWASSKLYEAPWR